MDADDSDVEDESAAAIVRQLAALEAEQHYAPDDWVPEQELKDYSDPVGPSQAPAVGVFTPCLLYPSDAPDEEHSLALA